MSVASLSMPVLSCAMPSSIKRKDGLALGGKGGNEQTVIGS